MRASVLHALAPLAYLLTFSCYGTHLPGSEKGWVDSQHSVYGTPLCSEAPARKAYWGSHLKEQPSLLDERARLAALEAILSVCQYRQWMAHAVHIRTTHVHAVIGGDATPEKMLSDFKAYATRALRAAGVLSRRRFWVDHGSTRYLWNDASVKAAVEYVVNGQGERMACYRGEPKVSF